MDNIVYTLLDDYCVCAVCRYFMMEAFITFKAIRFISNTAVFTQYAGAAGGATYNSSVVVTFTPAAQ